MDTNPFHWPGDFNQIALIRIGVGSGGDFGEKIVFAANANRTDGTLTLFIIDVQPGIFGVQRQFWPLLLQIVHCFA